MVVPQLPLLSNKEAMNPLNTELRLFCPCPHCPHYQQPENRIWKMGTYPVQSESRRRQLYWCSQGQHKFSETHFSELWGKQGSLRRPPGKRQVKRILRTAWIRGCIPNRNSADSPYFLYSSRFFSLLLPYHFASQESSLQTFSKG